MNLTEITNNLVIEALKLQDENVLMSEVRK